MLGWFIVSFVATGNFIPLFAAIIAFLSAMISVCHTIVEYKAEKQKQPTEKCIMPVGGPL
jgi:hypothetical protein